MNKRNPIVYKQSYEEYRDALKEKWNNEYSQIVIICLSENYMGLGNFCNESGKRLPDCEIGMRKSDGSLDLSPQGYSIYSYTDDRRMEYPLFFLSDKLFRGNCTILKTEQICFAISQKVIKLMKGADVFSAFAVVSKNELEERLELTRVISKDGVDLCTPSDK